MIPDDSIRDMIATEVRDAAERNRSVGRQKLLIPDKDEVLAVRCAYCDKVRQRPRRVIERDNSRQGFFACSNPCRRKQLAKRERLLVPMREEGSDDTQ